MEGQYRRLLFLGSIVLKKNCDRPGAGGSLLLPLCCYINLLCLPASKCPQLPASSLIKVGAELVLREGRKSKV